MGLSSFGKGGACHPLTWQCGLETKWNSLRPAPCGDRCECSKLRESMGGLPGVCQRHKG
ncbi:hypothetical protein NPIL_341551, partial [Nephila pilipes]